MKILLPTLTEHNAVSTSDHEERYKRTLDTSGPLIQDALRNIQKYADPSLDLVWRKLVIGQCAFEFELLAESISE